MLQDRISVPLGLAGDKFAITVKRMSSSMALDEGTRRGRGRTGERLQHGEKDILAMNEGICGEGNEGGWKGRKE